jgi:hypothetical protein
MTPTHAPDGGRLRAVRVLAVIMAVSAIGFGCFTIVFGIVSSAQAPHAFHNVVVASLLIVLSAPAVIAVARDPQSAALPLLVMTAVGTAGVVTMAIALTPDPFTLPFVVLVGVLWALLPNRSGAFPAGRPSAVLLVLVLAAAIPLATYAFDQAGIQRTDHTSEHAAFFHWVETAFYAVAIVFLGVLAGLRPSAFRLAAWCGAVGAIILGAGSLAFPTLASAVPMPWGWVAVAGGLAFLAVFELGARRSRSVRDRATSSAAG